MIYSNASSTTKYRQSVLEYRTRLNIPVDKSPTIAPVIIKLNRKMTLLRMAVNAIPVRNRSGIFSVNNPRLENCRIVLLQFSQNQNTTYSTVSQRYQQNYNEGFIQHDTASPCSTFTIIQTN